MTLISTVIGNDGHYYYNYYNDCHSRSCILFLFSFIVCLLYLPEAMFVPTL